MNTLFFHQRRKLQYFFPFFYSSKQLNINKNSPFTIIGLNYSDKSHKSYSTAGSTSFQFNSNTESSHQTLQVSYLEATKLFNISLPSFQQHSQNQRNIRFPIYQTDSAEDFLDHIREELHGQIEQVFVSTTTRSSSSISSRLSEKELVSMKIMDLIKENYVLWIQLQNEVNPKPYLFDVSFIEQKYKEIKKDCTATENLVNQLNQILTQMNNKSQLYTKLTEYSALTYLIGQLGTVIVLTYELGWDLMEPVSYLLTLGTSIMMFAFSCFKKQEYTYPNTKDWLNSIFFKRQVKKRNYNSIIHENLKKKHIKLNQSLSQFSEFLQLPSK